MKPKEPNTDETDFDPQGAEEAAAEITDLGVEPPPELPRGTEKVTKWDEAPDSSGSATPKVRPDDENQVGAELVQGGVESADRDQRLAGSDPDYEP